MARAKVSLGFCTVAALVRSYGGPSHDILGVRFDRTVPADTEFPTTIAQLDLFVRFFMQRPGDAEFRVAVWHLNADMSHRHLVRHRTYTRTFQLWDRALDTTFRVTHLVLSGPGDYAVKINRPLRPSWRGRRWRMMGQDYFSLRRDVP